MLGIEISRERGDYLFSFRPEQFRSVNWAGNPDKPVGLANGDTRLHPRKSFELRKKAVMHHSRRWKPCEIAAALDLKENIRSVIAGEEEIRARDRRRDATRVGIAGIKSVGRRSPRKGEYGRLRALIRAWIR